MKDMAGFWDLEDGTLRLDVGCRASWVALTYVSFRSGGYVGRGWRFGSVLGVGRWPDTVESMSEVSLSQGNW
jgi:hypothetical protein